MILTPEDGADRLSRNVGKKLLRNNPEERSSHLLRGGSLKSHILLLSVGKCRLISVKVGDIQGVPGGMCQTSGGCSLC